MKLLDDILSTTHNDTPPTDLSHIWADMDSNNPDPACCDTAEASANPTAVTLPFHKITPNGVFGAASDASPRGSPHSGAEAVATAAASPSALRSLRKRIAKLEPLQDSSYEFIMVTAAPVVMLLERLASYCIVDWRPHRVPADSTHIMEELEARNLHEHKKWFETAWAKVLSSTTLTPWLTYLSNSRELDVPFLFQYRYNKDELFDTIHEVHTDKVAASLCWVHAEGDKLIDDILAHSSNPTPVDLAYLWDDCRPV
jgi:hypothetical protein